MTQALLTMLLPLLVVTAGVVDILTLRIPAWLNLTIAALFLPCALVAGMPWPVLAVHLVTGLVLLAAGYAAFAAGLFGGGDAKLLAAAGLWFGFPAGVSFILYTAIAGGGLAVVIALRSRLERGRDGAVPAKPASLNPHVPYGYAFAIGTLLAWPQSWWIAASVAPA